MAKISGPFLSMTASGTVGNVLTAAKWKGIAYMRKWFVPANPQTVKQTNIRLAMAISVAKWGVMTEVIQESFNTGAEGTSQSGFNLFVSRLLDAYITQLTIDVAPTSVGVTGNYPDEVIVWA